MIYLDNAATTPMFRDCLSEIEKYSCENFYNASAIYSKGFENFKLLDEQREKLKKKLGVKQGEIIFTSGATEANNLAILGTMRNGDNEYVFSMGEHPSVYNVARNLEEKGNKVKFVSLTEKGQVNYAELEASLSEKTRLISVMYVSNETGAKTDIKRINDIRKRVCPKAIFHVDGVQAFCKIELEIESAEVDVFTLSAHKFHGPKGVGALYVRDKKVLKNINFGGGQEFGYRSGTENLSGIMAMTCAMEKIDVKANYDKVKTLRQILVEVLSQDDSIKILDVEGSPYILSMSFSGVNGETLIRMLENDVVIGLGSACSSKKAGNRILESMSIDKSTIKSSVRISFNAYQTEDEIKDAGEKILSCYKDLKRRVS